MTQNGVTQESVFILRRLGEAFPFASPEYATASGKAYWLVTVVLLTLIGLALAARTGHGSFVWEVIVPFTLAAAAGSLAGKRIADRLSAGALTLAFAALLVAVAVYVAARAGLALT